jgi:hypothetical protein
MKRWPQQILINMPATPTAQPRMPLSVYCLGYGGLIPFVVLAGLLVLDQDSPRWAPALNAYAAVILSFVGALHWAFGMLLPGISPQRRDYCYVWSVIPALMGWVALLIPIPLGHSLLLVGLALAYWQDAVLANHVALPAWYPRLRARLSIVACACLVIAAALSMLAVMGQ